MTIIATLGPAGSDCYRAAQEYDKTAEIKVFHRIEDTINCFINKESDLAVIPIYNTREGESREYFKLLEELDHGYWVDNVVLPVNLSLGAITTKNKIGTPDVIVGRGSVFSQCRDYITANFPEATLMAVQDIERSIREIKDNKLTNHLIVESEELLNKHDLTLLVRELVPHNKTRFAVIGKQVPSPTNYDATSLITRPLKDRVGLLVDILSEFTRRGINLLDLRTDNDIKTQKLQIYIETEGHIEDTLLKEALDSIEKSIIHEEESIIFLGSFPRIDMRVKKINSFGFVGTGAMSVWFAEKLESEGYKVLMSGRTTQLRPEEMIKEVDVVIICVPISVTAMTISQYGHLLQDGQALILLAGESENTLKTALEVTSVGVELMLVHNLWGPQALTMKDKNAAIVRTERSGEFCSEFEAFLYKHGADIYQDSMKKHDLLMGVGQKLPTTISVALAMSLKDHQIDSKDIASHSTLTSLYGILAMTRIHSQNPRTYAEIMATSGEGGKIVRSFTKNLAHLINLAENGKIDNLCELMDENRDYLTKPFLDAGMKQAKAVDTILAEPSGLKVSK